MVLRLVALGRLSRALSLARTGGGGCAIGARTVGVFKRFIIGARPGGMYPGVCSCVVILPHLSRRLFWRDGTVRRVDETSGARCTCVCLSCRDVPGVSCSLTQKNIPARAS